MFRRGIVACDECTKNCIEIHHLEQRGPSSTVSRFFKIMHGRNYSEVLVFQDISLPIGYLPPKFARVVRDLVGQKTLIEDSNRQKWTVEFSLVDGALAFQEGWHKFVEDHQLEHGEVLVFNYVKHGHFVVQIYGRSACEITGFNRGRKLLKKRSSDQETVFQSESHQIRNKRFTLTSENMEDPSCMLSRDSGQYELEHREFLFDLSNFEMGKNSPVAEKSGEEVYGFLLTSGEDEKNISTLGMKCGQISSSITKTELDMDNASDSAGATSPFSAEVKSLAFLELPLCTPSIQVRRERGHGKVVYLKDSTTRLWPVLYSGKSSVRAFTDGWRTFCKENSIGTGDACRFQVEKYMMPSCTLKVDIICNAGRSSEL